MGVGQASQDRKRLEEANGHLATITGQKPLVTKAKKAISAFRLRQGMEIGGKVAPARQRGPRDNSEQDVYGEQGEDRESEPQTEIQLSARKAVPVVRPTKRRVPQIQAVPAVFPQHGPGWIDSWSEEGELVIR